MCVVDAFQTSCCTQETNPLEIMRNHIKLHWVHLLMDLPVKSVYTRKIGTASNNKAETLWYNMICCTLCRKTPYKCEECTKTASSKFQPVYQSSASGDYQDSFGETTTLLSCEKCGFGTKRYTMKNYSNDNPCVEKFPMHVLETLAIVLNQLV